MSYILRACSKVQFVRKSGRVSLGTRLLQRLRAAACTLTSGHPGLEVKIPCCAVLCAVSACPAPKSCLTLCDSMDCSPPAAVKYTKAQALVEDART